MGSRDFAFVFYDYDLANFLEALKYMYMLHVHVTYSVAHACSPRY